MKDSTLFVKLLTRLAGIGKEGEIVSVSRSHAKNFLIPKGLAKEATPELISKEKEQLKKMQDAKRTLLEQEGEIAQALHTRTLEFGLRGTEKKVFGGVNEKDIIDAIEKQFHISLERANILLPGGHHIKTPGEHDVRIHIGHDSFIRMTVIVRPIGIS